MLWKKWPYWFVSEALYKNLSNPGSWYPDVLSATSYRAPSWRKNCDGCGRLPALRKKAANRESSKWPRPKVLTRLRLQDHRVSFPVFRQALLKHGLFHHDFPENAMNGTYIPVKVRRGSPCEKYNL